MFISGTAYDPAAPRFLQSTWFLGECDNGGTFLGSAVPGDVAGGRPRAFGVEVQIPSLNRGVDFAADAVSAISGQQTAITFALFVGLPAVKNPVATPTPRDGRGRLSGF
jgi:hypothetical protein